MGELSKVHAPFGQDLQAGRGLHGNAAWPKVSGVFNIGVLIITNRVPLKGSFTGYHKGYYKGFKDIGALIITYTILGVPCYGYSIMYPKTPILAIKAPI